MTVLKIVTAPNKILSEVSKPVQAIDETIRELANNMMQTMYEANGIGLSAVQVGVLKRIITVDVTQERDDLGNLISTGKQFIMINPEIIKQSEEKQDFEEGCLSFPGEHVKIQRPNKITVSFKNLDNEEQKLEADGLLSICIQHEIDHLEGITISNYISHLRRETMMKRLLKQKKHSKF